MAIRVRDRRFGNTTSLPALVFAAAVLLSGLTVKAAAEMQEAASPSTGKVNTDTKVKVFIFAGQSNMVGRSDPKLLPAEYREPIPNVRLYSNQSWRGFGGPIRSRNDGIGPEVSAARLIAKSLPGEKIVIVKTAVGGTNLHTQWNPQRENSLYARMLKDVKRATAGQEAEIMAIFWAQGGADTKSEAGAKAYGKNLADFIARARKDLGRADLPFIFSQAKAYPATSQFRSSKYPYRAEVAKGKAEVAKIVPNTATAWTNGLTVKAGHYDTAGTIEFGRRFFKAWEKSFHGPTAKE